ncbi:interferon-induced protein with tetratricopeptide repeats 5-like isoform X1 [Engystomops pustulosus]|uniref:interferon-induced protein with tetratricopeptide repeats 5-like isoform X1 n=1 Tax=Engystomops pustulosus TaxID=76066 RepID=UPI003AFA8598
MSGSSKTAMKLRLLQLKCHFTWKLLVQDTDPEELEERLFSQLTFLVTKNKYMVHNLLAYVMHLRGDHTKAIDHLKKAEEMIEEKNPEENSKKYLVTYGNYAWVSYYLNRYEDSQKYIEKIEQIYKDLKDKAEIAEIYGEKAWSLLKFCGQYYEDAKQSFEKALELEPEDPEWITGYATVVYRLEGFNKKPSPASTCKSLDLLKRAVEMNPTDAVVKALLALKLQDLNRTDEGIKYIEEAMEQAPKLPYLLRYVAKFYRRAGMIDDALSVLKTAVDVNPNSGFQHHQIGLCYRLKYFIQKKKFGNKRGEGLEKEMNDLIQNAIFHFEKTLEFKKTFVYAHVDLANMYSEAKEYQKAEDTFKTVLAFPSLKDEEKQQVYYNYGQFKEFCMRSEPEAIDYYKNCLQIKKSQKEREFAEKSVKRISAKKIRNSIHDAEGYALLGFLYKSNGDRNDAVDCYAKALEYDPNNAEYVSELCELKLMI